MKTYVQNTCEELYWETAKKAVAACKLVLVEALRLCRSIFRSEEEKALETRYGHLFASYGEGNVGGKLLDLSSFCVVSNALRLNLCDIYHKKTKYATDKSLSYGTRFVGITMMCDK